MDDFDIQEAKNLANTKGFRITKGYRMLVPVSPMPVGSHKDYYRHGIKKEVHRWLLDTMGPCGGYAEWELDPDSKSLWLYTGSQSKPDPDRTVFRHHLFVSMYFRHKRDAMLFKLTWAGKL